MFVAILNQYFGRLFIKHAASIVAIEHEFVKLGNVAIALMQHMEGNAHRPRDVAFGVDVIGPQVHEVVELWIGADNFKKIFRVNGPVRTEKPLSVLGVLPVARLATGN